MAEEDLLCAMYKYAHHSIPPSIMQDYQVGIANKRGSVVVICFAERTYKSKDGIPLCRWELVNLFLCQTKDLEKHCL